MNTIYYACLYATFSRSSYAMCWAQRSIMILNTLSIAPNESRGLCLLGHMPVFSHSGLKAVTNFCDRGLCLLTI